MKAVVAVATDKEERSRDAVTNFIFDGLQASERVVDKLVGMLGRNMHHSRFTVRNPVRNPNMVSYGANFVDHALTEAKIGT